jgi:hypothetical protein
MFKAAAKALNAPSDPSFAARIFLYISRFLPVQLIHLQ